MRRLQNVYWSFFFDTFFQLFVLIQMRWYSLHLALIYIAGWKKNHKNIDFE